MSVVTVLRLALRVRCLKMLSPRSEEIEEQELLHFALDPPLLSLVPRKLSLSLARSLSS